MYLTSDAESVAPMVFKGVFGLIQLNYIKTFFIAFLTQQIFWQAFMKTFTFISTRLFGHLTSTSQISNCHKEVNSL